MKNRRPGFFGHLWIAVFILLSSGCWPWPGFGDHFPAGSKWRFELRWELIKYSVESEEGCSSDSGPHCTCSGHQENCAPVYWEHLQILGGEFEVEQELGINTGVYPLKPLDVWAYMRVDMPQVEYHRACYYQDSFRITDYRVYNIHQVFNAADKLEWMGYNGNFIGDNRVNISIDPPHDYWEVFVTGYEEMKGSSGTQRWDINYPISRLHGQNGEAPIENGQWIEESEGTHFTDDGGCDYFHSSEKWVFSLQCIENCRNFDCSQPCYDANDCTDDTCIPGKGCTFEPLTGSCSNNECFKEGTCQDGVCVQTTGKNCDDGSICTKDDCDPLHGCTHDANDRPVRNTDPHDCWQTICLKGLEGDYPDPSETPPQGPPDDCYMEICTLGYGTMLLPTDQETPPQISPNDCLKQVCTNSGAVSTIPDATEPGCSCNSDQECEDGNPCTRETCDSATHTCVFHGPDDSLTPPEIPLNCNKEKCQGGQVVLIPDDDERFDLNPFDCMENWCEGGVMRTAPDPEELSGCGDYFSKLPSTTSSSTCDKNAPLLDILTMLFRGVRL